MTGQHIRLLELLPASDDEGRSSLIRCQIHSLPLSECPPYVALSYTWGTQAATREIELNGTRIRIRENLWWFLHHMQQRNEQKLLWVDALCIDQSNILERNYQVNIMRQIYSQASSVSVWLGRAADSSDMAMDYIRTKGLKPIPRRRGGFGNIWTPAEGKALLALCERRYWRRVWIVQEFLVAQRIEIVCGDKSVDWRSLDHIRQKLRRIETHGRIEHHTQAAAVLESYASKILEHKAAWEELPVELRAFSLKTMLEACCELESTDPRDKVFAILGLVRESDICGSQPVLVDYSKTTEEVYIDALLAALASGELENPDAKEQFSLMLQRSLRVSPPSSVVRLATKRVIETDAYVDSWLLNGDIYNSPLSELLLNGNWTEYPQDTGTFERLLIHPSVVEDLSLKLERMLINIQLRWQTLSNETLQAAALCENLGDDGSQDVQVKRLRMILVQIDELQAEFNTIHRIGEIIKSFRAKVEELDSRIRVLAG